MAPQPDELLLLRNETGISLKDALHKAVEYIRDRFSVSRR